MWKAAVVVPVFKGGIATNVSNYRPTCVASRVMERVIVSQITDFFLGCNVISKSQHGFLKRLSTCTNLLASFNDWIVMLHNHQSATVAYIDFAKAFDTVPHKKLTCRLECYVIDGCLLSWIKKCLSGRTHVIRVGGILSVSKDLTSSIVQGSGIGPLVFVTYINELVEILVC